MTPVFQMEGIKIDFASFSNGQNHCGRFAVERDLRLLSTKQSAFRKIARERAAFDEIIEPYTSF